MPTVDTVIAGIDVGVIPELGGGDSQSEHSTVQFLRIGGLSPYEHYRF